MTEINAITQKTNRFIFLVRMKINSSDVTGARREENDQREEIYENRKERSIEGWTRQLAFRDCHFFSKRIVLSIPLDDNASKDSKHAL